MYSHNLDIKYPHEVEHSGQTFLIKELKSRHHSLKRLYAPFPIYCIWTHPVKLASLFSCACSHSLNNFSFNISAKLYSVTPTAKGPVSPLADHHALFKIFVHASVMAEMDRKFPSTVSLFMFITEVHLLNHNTMKSSRLSVFLLWLFCDNSYVLCTEGERLHTRGSFWPEATGRRLCGQYLLKGFQLSG